METKCRFLARLVFILCISFALSAVTAQSSDYDKKARQVLDAANTKGGLIVHIGCGDGKLTAALGASDSYLVHGLDTKAGNVEKARAHIRSAGLYGSVSVERFDGKQLPYVDNLVNLLVAEDLGSVSMEEVLRVLASGGAVYTSQSGRWKKVVKPRPKNIDEWTHYFHDASNNAVAHDSVVGPPCHIQWVAEPPHTRSHEHIPSINALVSAKGRIFYIADEASIPESLGSKSMGTNTGRDPTNHHSKSRRSG